MSTNALGRLVPFTPLTYPDIGEIGQNRQKNEEDTDTHGSAYAGLPMIHHAANSCDEGSKGEAISQPLLYVSDHLTRKVVSLG